MGPRKFRLAVRKNAERNKYAAASSLKISIPKVKLRALGLASLKSQLCTALVSSPWTLTASDSESLQKIVWTLAENHLFCGYLSLFERILAGHSVFLGKLLIHNYAVHCPIHLAFLIVLKKCYSLCHWLNSAKFVLATMMISSWK